MSFEVQQLKDKPIVVITCHNPFDFTEDIAAANRQVAALLENRETITRIIDFTEIEMTFADLVESLATKTRAVPGSLRDTRVQTVFVGTHELVVMKAQSLRQEQYGGLNVPLFESLDEAIAHCRQLA
jgi:hypothetical protein